VYLLMKTEQQPETGKN